MQKTLMRSVMRGESSDLLLLLQHPPVYTVGRRGFSPSKHLAGSDALLEDKSGNSSSVVVHKVSRGGEVTWHGPGQLVAYPILDLSREPFRKDLRWYVRSVEEVAIRTLETYGLRGERHDEHTGVWVEKNKICAVGISVSKWVTMHGMALNVCNSLEPYQRIVPCGIREPDLGVCTIEGLLPFDQTVTIDVDDAERRLCDVFTDVFDVKLVEGR